jgi:sortase A
MIAGMLLAFFGVWDWMESRVGQTAAERNFIAAAEPAPRAPIRRIRVGDTLAKLSIPRLSTNLYVVEGDDDALLRRAPGHLPGSALPGMPGNSIIAGHRDTHFRVLKDIRPGDDILLQTSDGFFRYRVNSTHVVSPSDTASLAPASHAVLHLITCYPFYWVGSAPKRFVVEATLDTRVE